ncbi:hypothetical protein EGW08_010817 [Elysia chlorotica]|uniref:Peroxisomal membrane protein 2 n=1 Tax=Elysia chlorotica TaxID=188477 RepID=A0A3S0ZS61_ELYCH|nr:hypothetical protein EGW08_010817 [Elysia chlorotica]
MSEPHCRHGPKKRESQEGLFTRALKDYVRLLAERPVITKAVTNSIISAFGNIVSQTLAPDPATGGKINWRSVFAYSSFGFLVNGPLIHHFYAYVEKVLPKNQPNVAIKRVIFDRFVFAPPFLLLFLYYVAIVEGAGNQGAVKKIKETYWLILKLNWAVWSFVQYFNMNYIPLKFRTVFGNLCSLVWMITISILRSRMAAKQN